MTNASQRPTIGATERATFAMTQTTLSTERATFMIGSRPVPALPLPLARALPPPLALALALTLAVAPSFAQQTAAHAVVLHAAHLLEIGTGKVISPGEILVEGERISAVGTAVSHPAGAQVIDLGDSTLLPGLIDAHVHLF